MAKILIVDDDPVIAEILAHVVLEMGHEPACRLTLGEGLKAAGSDGYDLVLLDVYLPDGNGLDALPRFIETESTPEVIIVTGMGNEDGAELAIRSGAWDYIEKVSTAQNMSLSILRALQYREAKRAHASSRFVLDRVGIIGSSPRMGAVLDLLAKAAVTDANVLITGETGTGKELFAEAIHRNSSRDGKPFVVLDCSVLPETLVESTLFGHEKGAFTGADRTKEGLIKQADGGTLFLDEVGELPSSVQRAFLRVLEQRRFRPIGSRKEDTSDFRLVAASNRDLPQMAKDGLFREDILFRLKAFSIELPPLRERPSDIRELVIHYIDRLCHRYGTGSKGFSSDFMEALHSYHWPGNVRELFHAIERALAASGMEPILFPKHLPDDIRICSVKKSLAGRSPDSSTSGEKETGSDSLPYLKDFRKEMDQQYLSKLVSACRGNIVEACRKSGLSKSRLYELLKLHNMSV